MDTGIPARLSPEEGRKFGLSVGLAFLILGGILWLWRGHVIVPAVFASLGGPLILAGLVIPGKLGPVYRAWMGFALILSKITTPIFMGITFFLVIGPVALIMRLSGRNPVVRKESDGSFWVSRPEGPKRRSDLRRQF
ncbi:MAG: SxtJ family membrane protein [Gemmatimonadota bacterium]